MGITVPGWQPRAWAAQTQPWTAAYNVIVVGGGLSGCAAAIAAGRRGAKVALLEPTHILGGQLTVGGVGTVDQTPSFDTSVEQGIWGEITARIRAIYTGYGLTTQVARYRMQSSFATNAPVADRVLNEMCFEAGVDVLRNCPVSSASIDTTSATVSTPLGVLRAAVAIDATEDGSLLALANMPFRAGTQEGVGSSLPGSPTRIQSITQTAVIRRYGWTADDIPPQLRMTTPPPGYNLLPGYRNDIAATYPWKPFSSVQGSPNDFSGYRAYPDIADLTYYTALDFGNLISRMSLNYMNDTEIDTRFLTDPTYRAGKLRDALNATLSIIYYLQNEAPNFNGGQGLGWAIATDEGFAEGPGHYQNPQPGVYPDWVKHLPPVPYIRESRRLVGAYTLNGQRIKRPTSMTAAAWSTNAIATGTYPTDLHPFPTDNGELETWLGDSTDFLDPGDYAPYPIMFGCLVPQDDRRLIAAEKNISTTRIGSSSIRVHPSVTAIGEAAGVIAALSWKKGISPRRVSYKNVQVSLLNGRASLLPYPIYRIPATHKYYSAIALAVLAQRVGYTVQNAKRIIILNNAQLDYAKKVGTRLIKYWKGPV